MAEVSFAVAGDPAPQGSKSIMRGRLVESSRRVKPWREAVAEIAVLRRANQHLQGPVEVEALVYLKRPKAHYGASGNLRGDAPAYPLARLYGDTDKHARALLDALAMGGVFDDDSQVVDLLVRKRWAETGVQPGALITVRTVR